MTNKEQLIEQHIREYESRLKHIDELFQRAQKAAEQPDEKQNAEKLRDFAAQRALLQQTADHIKEMPLDQWREETVRAAGPMAVWDIYAQTLEDFIERHE
jgi:hypothetical protein